ncbi:O-antigen translocase [Psychroflexus sediminis]|uniref:Polysaccharide transporter, PST family n=1 Tax=Psychroflexus sediminis TaxID=470826 RepID=A0A1G7VDD9_9FLAO|nr:O-antigen translocase [Psychroflexus sediminis]SDG57578.1 polysaccharide transporter, PST family [Psychroflexus sediminis]
MHSVLKRLKTAIQQSVLLKVTSFNSFSVLIKMMTGLGVSKLTALLLGPQGLALIGNMRDALELFHKFSSGGLANAVVKYSAENKSNPKAFSSFLSTLVWSGIIACSLVMAMIFLFSEFINAFIFGSRDFVFIIRVMAFVLPLHVMNIYLMSILKGFSEFSKVIKINIASHILNLLLFALLVFAVDLKGAILSVVLVPSAMLFFTLYHVRNYFGRLNSFSWSEFSSPMLKNLGQFAFMTLISSVSFPLVFLGIRNFLINTLGEAEAGYWEAILRISNYYLLFVLSLLNLYILPKLAEAQTKSEFREIIFSFYKQILPLFALGLIVVYLLRDLIVRLIFSEEFLPAADLFLWQMFGDFFRILALVMVYQFHAKKMMWHYILTDLFLALGLYFSALYFIPRVGLEGVVIGHALTYVVYFLIILSLFSRTLFFSRV